jgi:DNA modification methylase
MGKDWDHGVPSAAVWREVLRVLKPGAPMLAFGGTRTHHRLMCAIEDAGFEIRDCLMWLYGSGFPKSYDISKGIDARAGAERPIAGRNPAYRPNEYVWNQGGGKTAMRPEFKTASATPEAERWNGYGTALKPAWEPIVLAMAPTDGTFAQNALEHDVAGLNIDGCRIEGKPPSVPQPTFKTGRNLFGTGEGRNGEMSHAAGRWPANLILDEGAAALLDEQSGVSGGGKFRAGIERNRARYFGEVGSFGGTANAPDTYGDSGGASRFFYTAKASRRERNEGLEYIAIDDAEAHAQNTHPCVKPLSLTTYLARLILPPSGRQRRCLIPFCGSGSEVIGAQQAGFEYALGIDLNPEYVRIARARLHGGFVEDYDDEDIEMPTPIRRSGAQLGLFDMAS